MDLWNIRQYNSPATRKTELDSRGAASIWVRSMGKADCMNGLCEARSPIESPVRTEVSTIPTPAIRRQADNFREICRVRALAYSVRSSLLKSGRIAWGCETPNSADRPAPTPLLRRLQGSQFDTWNRPGSGGFDGLRTGDPTRIWVVS